MKSFFIAVAWMAMFFVAWNATAVVDPEFTELTKQFVVTLKNQWFWFL